MNYWIDESDDWLDYALAGCECGWRAPATGRAAAEQRLAVHETNMHPGERTVRGMLEKRAQRAHSGRPRRHR